MTSWEKGLLNRSVQNRKDLGRFKQGFVECSLNSMGRGSGHIMRRQKYGMKRSGCAMNFSQRISSFAKKARKANEECISGG